MADDSREKFINPYSVLDDLDFLDETKVNWESEESKKVYWDNYSVMKTAVDKGFHIGVMKVKTATAHRMQAMGYSLEQIAQFIDLNVHEAKILLQR